MSEPQSNYCYSVHRNSSGQHRDRTNHSFYKFMPPEFLSKITSDRNRLGSAKFMIHSHLVHLFPKPSAYLLARIDPGTPSGTRSGGTWITRLLKTQRYFCPNQGVERSVYNLLSPSPPRLSSSAVSRDEVRWKRSRSDLYMYMYNISHDDQIRPPSALHRGLG